LNTAITCLTFLCAVSSSFAQPTWRTLDYSRRLDSQLTADRDSAERASLEQATRSRGFVPERTVSAARLRHKPPAKALAAFVHGMQFAGQGSPKKSVAEFEKAVQLDPEFSEAIGNLGVQYLTLGLVEKAATQLRRAIQVDAATSTHHANLALVLMLLHELPEAELEAKTALALDPASSRAHYLLGCLLTQRQETWHSAQEHLRFAAEEFPDAHAALADLYAASGEDALAAAESDLYRRAQSGQIRQKQSGHSKKSSGS